MFSNKYLLGGIAAEIALAALFVYTPAMQTLLGTAALPPSLLLLLLPYPLTVWGADELLRYLLRRSDRRRADRARTTPSDSVAVDPTRV